MHSRQALTHTGSAQGASQSQGWQGAARCSHVILLFRIPVLVVTLVTHLFAAFVRVALLLSLFEQPCVYFDSPTLPDPNLNTNINDTRWS